MTGAGIRNTGYCVHTAGVHSALGCPIGENLFILQENFSSSPR